MMTAFLSQYAEIADSQTSDGRPAVVPTRIELEHTPWPGVPTVLKRMSIALSDIHSVPGEFGGDPKGAAKFRQNLPDVPIHWIDGLVPAQKGTP